MGTRLTYEQIRQITDRATSQTHSGYAEAVEDILDLVAHIYTIEGLGK